MGIAKSKPKPKTYSKLLKKTHKLSRKHQICPHEQIHQVSDGTTQCEKLQMRSSRRLWANSAWLGKSTTQPTRDAFVQMQLKTIGGWRMMGEVACWSSSIIDIKERKGGMRRRKNWEGGGQSMCLFKMKKRKNILLAFSLIYI